MRTTQLMKNEKGSTLIITMMMMVVFGMAAMGASQLVSSERGASVNEYQNSQVMGVGTAGLEYAMRQVDLGYNPSVSGHPLAGGSFDVEANPQDREITVTSRFGSAVKRETIQRNFGADCLKVDLEHAHRNYERVDGIQLYKICNQTIGIRAVSISWNSHSCVTNEVHDPINNDLEAKCTNQGLVDTNNSHVVSMGFDAGWIYDSYNGVGAPLTGAESGERIDVTDFSINDAEVHYTAGPQNPDNTWPGPRIKDVAMNGIIPRTLITLNFEMTDGSTKKEVFQLN